MKEYYQPKGGKKGKFALRENTYRRTWYLIADYPYFKAVERGMTEAAVVREPEGMQYDKYIKAIEDAKEQIPEAYADYIMRHIVERIKYKDIEGISEKTLKLWTQRFIWYVADNMGDV